MKPRTELYQAVIRPEGDKPAVQAYLERDGNDVLITPAGRARLKELVNDVDGNVYTFKDGLSNVTIAAAMARLSRRRDDLRLILLDEFLTPDKRDEQLLNRVITEYGDDSVQQLVGCHLVVEKASNLLTKHLQWGRLGAYLEQSTRYIYYDQKDASGHYRYVVPPEIQNQSWLSLYQKWMDEIFDNYSTLVHQLTEYLTRQNEDKFDTEEPHVLKRAIRAQACDAARGLLPVATQSTVGLFMSAQSLENLVVRLAAEDLDEMRQTSAALLQQGRQTLDAFLQRADLPNRGGATSVYLADKRDQLRELVAASLHEDEFLGRRSEYLSDRPHAELVDYNYTNELDLVPDMLYEQSRSSLNQLREQVATWSVEQKLAVFDAYVGERLNRRQKPGRAFEKIHYDWDIVCDYGIFRDLQRHRMVEDLTWQQLTPYLGYQVPALVEESGSSEIYHQTCRHATHLYEFLRTNCSATVAQYATLLGHQMRWKISYNARQAFHMHELRTSPQGHPGYRQLVNSMHEQISQIHPHLAKAMRFVNQAEDPELTRLQAEKYQARKSLAT